MKTSEILIQAWKKIEDPKHWTQGALARDSVGEHCSPYRPEAVCWCAQGAVMAVPCEVAEYKNAFNHITGVAVELNLTQVYQVNDNLGHKTVGWMFARAIELAEQEESNVSESKL